MKMRTKLLGALAVAAGLLVPMLTPSTANAFSVPNNGPQQVPGMGEVVGSINPITGSDCKIKVNNIWVPSAVKSYQYVTDAAATNTSNGTCDYIVSYTTNWKVGGVVGPLGYAEALSPSCFFTMLNGACGTTTMAITSADNFFWTTPSVRWIVVCDRVGGVMKSGVVRVGNGDNMPFGTSGPFNGCIVGTNDATRRLGVDQTVSSVATSALGNPGINTWVYSSGGGADREAEGAGITYSAPTVFKNSASSGYAAGYTGTGYLDNLGIENPVSFGFTFQSNQRVFAFKILVHGAPASSKACVKTAINGSYGDTYTLGGTDIGGNTWLSDRPAEVLIGTTNSTSVSTVSIKRVTCPDGSAGVPIALDSIRWWN